MPRPKKIHPQGAAPPPIAPSKTSHLFPRRKTNDRAPLTHEAIEEDLEAFRKSGGKIEVLGVTRTLQRINADPSASPSASSTASPATPDKPAPARRR